MGMRYREIMYGAEANLSTKDQFMVKQKEEKKKKGLFKNVGKKKDKDKKGKKGK